MRTTIAKLSLAVLAMCSVNSACAPPPCDPPAPKTQDYACSPAPNTPAFEKWPAEAKDAQLGI